MRRLTIAGYVLVALLGALNVRLGAVPFCPFDCGLGGELNSYSQWCNFEMSLCRITECTWGSYGCYQVFPDDWRMVAWCESSWPDCPPIPEG